MRTYPVAVSVEAMASAWARQEQAPEGATVVAAQELAADPAYVDGVLKAGAERASSTANQVMERVRRAVGLRD